MAHPQTFNERCWSCLKYQVQVNNLQSENAELQRTSSAMAADNRALMAQVQQLSVRSHVFGVSDY